MTSSPTRTALVTGATSGLGLEAAAQLPEAGYDRVIITGRSAASAEKAQQELVRRTGSAVFETLVLDLNSPGSVTDAALELATRDLTIDFLLLNAGMVSGAGLVRTDADVEITFASSLVGHHQLTNLIIDADLLNTEARIVIAGSEAARNDVPTFKTADLATVAKNHFGDDRVAAAEALIRGTAPVKYNAANTYATAKLFVAWWAAELSRRLPDGMTVNAVSPGSAPDTGAARHATFFMRRIMMPVMKTMPKFMGMAATTDVAARRYIDASNYDAEVTGQFFASAPKKMTGPLHRMEHAHIHDATNQAAAWEALEKVSPELGAPLST